MDRRISQLEQIIKRDEEEVNERHTRGRPVVQSAYAALSDKYHELFLLNNDTNAFHSAIENINQAMAMSDELELQYLAKRADIYIGADAYEQAKQDITTLGTAISNLTYPHRFRGIYRIYIEHIRKKFASKYERRAITSPRSPYGGGLTRSRRTSRSPPHVHPLSRTPREA